MARPKSNGQYAKLSATYYFDDAILEAGEQAEVMWTRCLAFLSASSSDGFVTEMQMRAAVGIGLRSVPKRVEKLIEVGLLERVDGGFVARSWLKWNKTASEIGRELAKDRERKARKDAENTPNSERKSEPFQPDSSPQYKDKSIQVKDKDKDTGNEPLTRPDVSSLCTLLADLIEANGSRRPNITKAWATSARLLLDADGRDHESASRLIRWTQGNSFWKANVLSMPKFREKYDQLRLAANKELEDRQQGTRGNQRDAELMAFMTAADNNYTQEIER
jgi:hypothetical protein